MAKGEISDLRELREIVSRSVTPQVYYPKKIKSNMETPKTGYQSNLTASQSKDIVQTS